MVAFRIDPEQFYDEGAVVLCFDISSTIQARARRSGKLRYTKAGKRVLYKGAWLLEWLSPCVVPAKQEAAACVAVG